MPLNRELMQKTMDQILLHPETWNQSVWHSDCGTSHCFAGWAQNILVGRQIKNKGMHMIEELKPNAKSWSGQEYYDIQIGMAEELGLTEDLSNLLFNEDNGIVELHTYFSALMNLDAAGFDLTRIDSEGDISIGGRGWKRIEQFADNTPSVLEHALNWEY